MTPAQTAQITRLAKRTGRSMDDLTEMFEERAAIREFEAGKRRRDAEGLALNDVAGIVLR